ncbi:MAG: hypothetical protein ACR2NN_23485 [Bryobacteraceae bacterium]
MRISGSQSSAVIAGALCFCAFAQAPESPEHPAGIENLVDGARAVPVEFRADVLFRLIDAGKITAPKAQREILEGLFAAASQAQYPMALLYAGTHTDTRSWAVASGLGLGLDTLSIRSRAVKKMLTLDPARARELFLEIALAMPADPSCEEDLVPNGSALYDTAREVMDRSFTVEERNRGDAVQFFEPYLRSIPASTTLPAAAKTIRMMKASAEQRQKLVNIFASRLNDIADGDRAFSLTMGRLALGDQIIQLSVGSRKQGVPADTLLAAYRTFLVKHLTGERCSDAGAKAANEAVTQFNERLRLAGYLASVDLNAITNGESKPLKVDGKAKVVEYWRTPQARRLLLAIKHLRFGDSSQPLTVEQKLSVEWQNELRQFLSDLAAWNPRDEASPAEYFHEGAILYAGLIDLMPNGPLRDSVVQGSIAFLSQNPMETDSPAQFLPHLNALLQQARTLASGAAILDAMRNAKDPVISLYGNLERVAPLP